MDLSMRVGERGFIVGQTGSGKTTLSHYLFPAHNRILIIDPKSEYEYDKKIYKTIDNPLNFKIDKKKPFKIVYRPKPELLNFSSGYNVLYKRIFENGNAFCYTDEAIPTLEHGRSSIFMKLCYQLGRSRKIGMLTGTQRPFMIPKELFTESNKFYIFRLLDFDDKTRMQKLIGNKTLIPTGYEFIYADTSKNEPIHKYQIKQ